MFEIIGIVLCFFIAWKVSSFIVAWISLQFLTGGLEEFAPFLMIQGVHLAMWIAVVIWYLTTRIQIIMV